jgi:steroid delta-isomerase
MSTPEDNAKTVKRYLDLAAQGDVEAIVELYADDGTVEDPVGSEVHIGRQAIHGFYSQIPDTDKSTELDSLRTLGNEAAFSWALIIDLGEGGVRIEIISTMTFNEDGKIASMKAYWGPENIKPLAAGKVSR